MCIRDSRKGIFYDSFIGPTRIFFRGRSPDFPLGEFDLSLTCLLYTSDAADERSSVDLGGRRIIKKKNND